MKVFSTRPNLDIILSAGVEVPDIVKYFLATLAIIGYYAFLLLHHSNGYPSDLNLGSALYLFSTSHLLILKYYSTYYMMLTEKMRRLYTRGFCWACSVPAK